jgi:hypothetical protein
MENNWSQRTGLYWLSFAINFRRSCSYFLLSGAPVLKLCTLDSKSREAQVLDVLNGFAVRNKLPEESRRFPFQGDNEFEGDFVKDFAKLSAYVKKAGFLLCSTTSGSKNHSRRIFCWQMHIENCPGRKKKGDDGEWRVPGLFCRLPYRPSSIRSILRQKYFTLLGRGILG